MAMGGSGLAVFWRGRPVTDEVEDVAAASKEAKNRIDDKLDGLASS